jgi:hypothetical protein
MKNTVLLLIGTCVLASSLLAAGNQTQMPESYIALLRSGVQNQKTAIVAGNLALSDEQAKKFWPIQRSYETDLAKLNDTRLEIIREYANSWSSLSNSTANDLGKRMIAFEKKRIALRGKHFGRMSKDTSPIVAAKFFQIESQMEDMIDINIASSVPLIQQ